MIVFKLAEPIVMGSQTIEELELPEKPTMAQLRRLPVNVQVWTWDQVVSYIAVLSKQPEAVIGQVSQKDAVRLLDLVTGFF